MREQTPPLPVPPEPVRQGLLLVRQARIGSRPCLRRNGETPSLRVSRPGQVLNDVLGAPLMRR
jgi:hypothetical protein